jgi:hypothetical protein
MGKCGTGGGINELYFTVTDADSIDYDKLPDAFALKCNHGCAYNIIVPDKKDFSKSDFEAAKKKLKYWMAEDYGVKSGEYHYKGIPRKIMCEKYIGTPNGALPSDYKFFASYGRVICCQVLSNRETQLRMSFVDRDFNNLRFTVDDEHYPMHSDSELAKLCPDSFADMLIMAEKLSIDFPIVRVDIYDFAGTPIFGELTFSPYGGYLGYINTVGQEYLAERVIDNGWKAK